MCLFIGLFQCIVGKIATFTADLKCFIWFTVCLHRFGADHIQKFLSLEWRCETEYDGCMCASRHNTFLRIEIFNRKTVAPVCCCSQIQINEQHHQINKCVARVSVADVRKYSGYVVNAFACVPRIDSCWGSVSFNDTDYYLPKAMLSLHM